MAAQSNPSLSLTLRTVVLSYMVERFVSTAGGFVMAKEVFPVSLRCCEPSVKSERLEQQESFIPSGQLSCMEHDHYLSFFWVYHKYPHCQYWAEWRYPMYQIYQILIKLYLNSSRNFLNQLSCHPYTGLTCIDISSPSHIWLCPGYACVFASERLLSGVQTLHLSLPAELCTWQELVVFIYETLWYLASYCSYFIPSCISQWIMAVRRESLFLLRQS